MFCQRPRRRADFAFAIARPRLLRLAGSGITPVISIIKTAWQQRHGLSNCFTNRDRDSIIFAEELDDICRGYTSRLQITHHLDNADGFIDLAALKRFISGNQRSDLYICGPGRFMDLVEQALADREVDGKSIFIERFISLPDNSVQPIFDEDTTVGERRVIGDVVFIIRRIKRRVSYRAGETL